MTPHKSQIVNVVDLKLACEDARLRPEGDVGPWRAQTNRNRAPARGLEARPVRALEGGPPVIYRAFSRLTISPRVKPALSKNFSRSHFFQLT